MPRRQTVKESSTSMRMEHFSVSKSEKSVVTSTPIPDGGGFTNLRLKSPEFLSPSIIASPNWIPGSQAVFRTPRTPSPVKTRRRTTMIRTEIMSTERDTPVWRQSIAGDVPHDFKVPSLMFVSPPGVKTRSRRSSMFIPSQPEKTTKPKGKLTASKGANAQKQVVGVKRAGRTTRKNVTNITSEKVALSEINIDMANLGERGSNAAGKPQAKKANQSNATTTRSKRSAKSENASLKTKKQISQSNLTSPSRKEISSPASKTPSRKRKMVSPVRSIDNEEKVNKEAADVKRVSVALQQNKSGIDDLFQSKRILNVSLSKITTLNGVPIAERSSESPIISTVKAKASPAKKNKASPAKKEKASPAKKEKASPASSAIKSSRAKKAVKSSPAIKQKASPARSAVKSSPAVQEKASPARSAIKSSPAKKAVKSSPPRSAVKSSPARSAVKSSPAIKEKASPARSAIKSSPAKKAVKSSPAIKQKASPARSAVKSSPAVQEKTSPARSAVKSSPAIKQKASPARIAVKSSPARSAVNNFPAVKEKASPAVKEKASPARSAVISSLTRSAVISSPAIRSSLARKDKDLPASDEKMYLDRKVEMAISGIKENETINWNETSLAKTEKLFPSMALETESLTNKIFASRQATIPMSRNILELSPSRNLKRASLSAKAEVASPAGKIARTTVLRESYDFEVTDVEEQQSLTDDLNMTLSHTTHSSRCTIL